IKRDVKDLRHRRVHRRSIDLAQDVHQAHPKQHQHRRDDDVARQRQEVAPQLPPRQREKCPHFIFRSILSSSEWFPPAGPKDRLRDDRLGPIPILPPPRLFSSLLPRHRLLALISLSKSASRLFTLFP